MSKAKEKKLAAKQEAERKRAERALRRGPKWLRLQRQLRRLLQRVRA